MPPGTQGGARASSAPPLDTALRLASPFPCENAIFVYVMAGQGLIGINQSEASNLHPAILHKFC